MKKNISIIFSTGDICNMKCKYCYVRGENIDYFNNFNKTLSLDTVERALILIKKLDKENCKKINFSYHGGEPLLLGKDFFIDSFKLQKKILNNYTINNSIQTNGLLLNEEFFELAKKYNYCFGISLDGPKALNDLNRCDYQNDSVFDKIMNNIKLLQKNHIPFGILAVVTKESLAFYKEIITFMEKSKIGSISFNPCITDKNFEKFDYTITPREYGSFLVNIFNEWIIKDNPNIMIDNFYYTMRNLKGKEGNICKFTNTCIGNVYTIYPDNSIYICPNIRENRFKLGTLDNSVDQIIGKANILSSLYNVSKKCLLCEYNKLCYGSCIQERTTKSENIRDSYYYCDSYKQIFKIITNFVNNEN